MTKRYQRSLSYNITSNTLYYHISMLPPIKSIFAHQRLQSDYENESILHLDSNNYLALFYHVRLKRFQQEVDMNDRWRR